MDAVLSAACWEEAGEPWGGLGVTEAATAARTRPLTLLRAAARLGLLPAGEGGGGGDARGELRVHVVGANREEGVLRGWEGVAAAFAPLCALVAGRVRTLSLLMVGPDVPEAMAGRTESRPAGGLTLNVSYRPGLYHEPPPPPAPPPDLAVCFNAGLWGYDSWGPTIACLASRAGGCPVVITSYTEEEAEEDYDMLAGLEGVQHIWREEANPFASRMPRAVGGTPRDRENAWWCCVGPAAARPAGA